MSELPTTPDEVPLENIRSTLQRFSRAIRQEWGISDAMRTAALATAVKAMGSPTERARIAGAKLVALIDFQQKEFMLRALEREADAALLGLSAEKSSGSKRTDVEEVVMIRVRRIRSELQPNAAGSLDRVVNAGLRRLGLPERDAPGDGAAEG